MMQNYQADTRIETAHVHSIDRPFTGYGDLGQNVTIEEESTLDPMARRGPRLTRNEQGNTAIEFALIMPVLLTLVFACLEFGMIAYTYNATGSVARDAARQMAINQLLPENVDAYVRGKLPNWIRQDAQLAVTQSDEDDPKLNRFTLDVQFPATSATPSRFLSTFYKTLVVDIKVTMQQEPTL